MGFGGELQVFAVLLDIVALWTSIPSQAPSRRGPLHRVDDTTIARIVLCPAIGVRSPRGIARTRWRARYLHFTPDTRRRSPRLTTDPRPPRFRSGSSPDDANDGVL
ncbi:hypothetical protein C8R44DRAFT_805229, partial [Mycena epipterygia]